jgi:signal transduction histidine kinase
MPDTINILLVDDEPRNLDALEAILDDPSYRLLRAVEADAALRLLLDHDVAAIVLDIKMPGISGFELAQLIKGTKKFRQIPIVFLTAHLVDDKDVLAGYGAGAVDYLTKPVNPMILRHKVAVFADLFRKTRALAELNDTLEERVLERTAELERSEAALRRQKDAESALRKEAEVASRMKDDFLAMMSHELRTPLNAMLGWATILKDDAKDAAKLKRGLDVIERNARAQTRLVNDLLDVSRIVSGKLRVNSKNMQLSTAIHAAAEVVRPAAEAKGVRLVVDLDADLGAMLGDSERLQQVAWNLLVNAIRFTPAEGRVTVTARRDGSAITMRVEDTGIGIPAEHLPHIFERFRQIDSSTTRAHGGLGLGLAIVRHLVEAHGGTVEAASDGLGRGSSFTLSLPIRAVDLSSAGAGVNAEPRTGADAQGEIGTETQDEAAHASSPWREKLANVRALVVDDDRDSLDLLRIVLEDAGAKVTTARSAREALDIRGPFDIVISDIGMPEMDGYSLIRSLRSRSAGASVPAIALTAYARAEDADRAIRAGYQAHLTKPVDARTLVETAMTLVQVKPGTALRAST